MTGVGSLRHELVYGWTYISSRAGLCALMVSFAIANFLFEMIAVLYTPLILAFTSPAVLGTVLSLGGIGYLAGSVLMSTWKGPQRHIALMIVAMLLLGVFITLIGLSASIPLITGGIFLSLFCLPIVTVSNQVIWQRKVAPDVQGRVFAIRQTIQWTIPLAADLIAGPLADRVFEPLLITNGPLAPSVGQIIGVGPGRGVGLLIMNIGLLLMVLAVSSYLYPRLRQVEDELPDVMVAPRAASESGRPLVTVPVD